MEYGILSGTTQLAVILVFSVVCSTSAQYTWGSGSWSECQARDCGINGHQIRDIQCFYQDQRGELILTNDENCQHLQRPPTHQACFKECQDNIYEVVWAEDTWGPCQLRPKVKVCARGMGVQYRNITCVFRADGQLQADSICESYKPKPPTEKNCELHCKQDCIVTPWTSWSNCDKCDSVARTRTRSVVIPNDHGGKECPPFSEIDPCANCTNVYYVSLDQWSPCVSMEHVIPDNYPHHPSIGHQKRSVKCIDSIGAARPYINCKNHIQLHGKHISDHQSCIIPQDCEVSDWSEWMRYNTSCLIEPGLEKPGFLRHERLVKQLPRGMGQSCPPLVQTTEVQGSKAKLEYCPRSKWLTSGWSKCMQVNSGLQCSKGMQHRKAICVEENEKGEQKPIDASRCADPRPTISRLCKADCDWDCTVSLWSQWTECKVTECDQYARKRRNNQKTGQRYRTRTVLTPAGANGRQCPHLSETQNCDPEPCYFWNTSTGPCSLSKSKKNGENCGVGMAERRTTCVNRRGMGVKDDLCSEWQTKPELQVLCEIPCRYDCVTSEWGEWTECPDICEADQDKAIRPNMRSRQKTILARAGPGGTECPGERELRENKPCPTVIECAVFIWHADPWGPCMLEDSRSKCGSGTQIRGVHCYNNNNQLVQDEKCTQSVKPKTAKSCTIPCPMDCILTAYSDWSPCSASCYKAKDNIPTRSRQRFILQEPDNGGIPCPEILQEVQTCLNLPLCHQYQWTISNWSQCILAPNIHHCGKGLRARDITCIAQNGTSQPIEVCLKFLGPMPMIAEPCYVTCDKQCLFTDWSEWSHCIQGCEGHQFRARTLKDGPTVPESCTNSRLYPIYEKRPCQLCEKLKPTSMGEWSDCILEPVQQDSFTNQPELTNRKKRNTTSLDMGNICGTGKRIKVVACSSPRNGLESADMCTGAGYEEEVCFLACPVDCEMSDWTSWSDCPATCGAGEQTRYRSIRRLPSAGGRQCPSLGTFSKEMQTRLCHPECVRHVWKSKPWGTCIPYNNQVCGNGTQTRHVRCEAVNRHGFTTSIAMDHLCTSQQRPPKTQNCYLFCPEDCVVSMWTKWTSCGQPCNRNARQQRRRTVLREGVSDQYNRYFGNSRCPDTRQTKPCIKGDNCFEFAWTLSNATTCLINNGMDDCGVGHKERYPICKNHLEQVVDDEFCEEVLGPVTEPLVITCEEVCDVDCLVSDWSPWSSCSKTCGLGVSQRERTIVEYSSRNGRPCPEMLTQKKPCFLRGCYKWSVSDWSNCTAESRICGNGIQRRNISCVSEDGIPQDSSKCQPDLDILIMHTERECMVPCPGECVITEWTEWNQCYLSEADFFMGKYNDRGIQSRSRAILAYPKLTNQPCPDKLWEKRFCYAERGMHFAWRTTPWDANRDRRVWCERSDGLVVTGGCDISLRPPTILVCIPLCPVNSVCNDTNTCICKNNLVPEYENGFVTECREANMTVSPEGLETVTKKAETSIWMYAVLAAGTVFIVFVALAFYNMSEHFRSGPRPRSKEDEEAAEKLNAETIETRQENGLDQLEHCPNVCTHNSAPTPANTNHLYENSNTNALWVRASTKSVRNRVARKFYSVLYFCGCSKHVHDTDYKETYTACVESPIDDDLFKRVPDVDYSDQPTISNESSVDIEMTESTPKKPLANGSDSAISMQNSSNDSRRTADSYASAGTFPNYSKADKRLKKYANSFDKPKSFDSYVIAECDVNGNENDVGVVKLEHISAKFGKSSLKSSLSHDSSETDKKFGKSVKNSVDDGELEPGLGVENGSGLFTVNCNECDNDESLVEEMNTFSRLLFSKHKFSEDSCLNDNENVCLQEQKPLLGDKPKLHRQQKVVSEDSEDMPLVNDQNKLLGNLDVDQDQEFQQEELKPFTDLEVENESDNTNENKLLNDPESNDSCFENDLLSGNQGHSDVLESNNSLEKEHIQNCDNNDEYIANDNDSETPLSDYDRANSWDTFKDMATRPCYNSRKKLKTSKTTTV